MCMKPSDNKYDPDFVAELFDRCSSNYRVWSAISSFGFVWLWRRQCIALVDPSVQQIDTIVDLMAGTGEVWPHVLRRFDQLKTIKAIDISHRMHVEALERIHRDYAEMISHEEANVLTAELAPGQADLVVSTFGLKTFNAEQQAILAKQIARILKPGGHFALIEASDPTGWIFRPLYRFYLDRVLPNVERFILKGANDFSMIGDYTREFGDCSEMAQALREEGLQVEFRRHFFGCATSVSGCRPQA